jgi:hypothetical protein
MSCHHWKKGVPAVGIKIAFIALALYAIPARAEPAIDIGIARASLVGSWEGQLEYLDYSADKWFGIPVMTSIEDGGDGATMIRKSDFDDGPKVGNVRITSIELFDAATQTMSVGTFRKGKQADISNYSMRFEGTPADATHWTIVEETSGMDDNRPATLRTTTTRDGDHIIAVKQVDFQDDDKAEWMVRNRTRLTRLR